MQLRYENIQGLSESSELSSRAWEFDTLTDHQELDHVSLYGRLQRG